MRTLGKPFNPPGVEAMIDGFYREARIASSVTAADRALRSGDTATALVRDTAVPAGQRGGRRPRGSCRPEPATRRAPRVDAGDGRWGPEGDDMETLFTLPTAPVQSSPA